MKMIRFEGVKNTNLAIICCVKERWGPVMLRFHQKCENRDPEPSNFCFYPPPPKIVVKFHYFLFEFC